MLTELQIVDAVITRLDQLSVKGVQNMGLVIDCVNALGALRERFEEKKEEQADVPTDPE